MTREEMAVTLTSYAAATGQPLPVVRQRGVFDDGTDFNAIAAYEVSYVQLAVMIP